MYDKMFHTNLTPICSCYFDYKYITTMLIVLHYEWLLNEFIIKIVLFVTFESYLNFFRYFGSHFK